MYKNRIETQSQTPAQASHQISSDGDEQNQFAGEIVAKVKKLAVEKPVVVVAAGLAIGVLAGFMLKRN
ncbi:hypothetical protein N9Y42_10130 [Mariniblastus sp.]|nr:hypothetical protein [Mariniblastus sp.]